MTIAQGRGRRKAGTRSGASTPWASIALFLGPPLLFYIVFTIYPLLATIWYSFNNMVPAGGKIVTTFAGLGNYRALLSDSIFLQAVLNTAIWGVVGPTLEMVTALALAIVLYFKVPLHRFFRTAWVTPYLVSGVVVGIVFRWILGSDWGLLNNFLRAVGLKALALDWMGRTDTVLWMVILVHWWHTFGYSFILLLAGLTAIPEELLEAAYIDGASRLQTSFRILLPLLRPTAVTVLILSFIGKMQAFNVVWVLSNGGPMHASETVATYVQKRAFGWFSLDLGYPSAIAVVWFGVVAISVGLISRRLTPRAD